MMMQTERESVEKQTMCDKLRNVMSECADMLAAKEGPATRNAILATDRTSTAYKRFLA